MFVLKWSKRVLVLWGRVCHSEFRWAYTSHTSDQEGVLNLVILCDELMKCFLNFCLGRVCVCLWRSVETSYRFEQRGRDEEEKYLTFSWFFDIYDTCIVPYDSWLCSTSTISTQNESDLDLKRYDVKTSISRVWRARLTLSRSQSEYYRFECKRWWYWST